MNTSQGTILLPLRESCDGSNPRFHGLSGFPSPDGRALSWELESLLCLAFHMS
jgi:hypothetical protein